MPIAIDVLSDIDQMSSDGGLLKTGEPTYPYDYELLVRRFGACQITYRSLAITLTDLINGYPPDLIADLRDTVRDANQHVPSVYPPLYPAPDGILPVGCDNEGHVFGWVTSGSCTRWTTFIDNRSELIRYPVGLINLLISNIQVKNLNAFWQVERPSEALIFPLQK